MVATVVLLVIIGGVLQLISQSQQRTVATASAEDSTSMAREAVDLMTRDIRLAGYPPPSSYPAAVLNSSNQQYVTIAGGFLGVAAPATPNLPASPYSIQFEADISGPTNCGTPGLPLTDYRCTGNSGVVSVINYQLQVPTGGAAGGCAGLTVNANLTTPTLMRSQVPKNANGAAVTPVYIPFVTNVQNCISAVPIFTYCGPVAAAGGCPDLSGQPPAPAGVTAPRNTRMVLIRLQVQSRVRDPQSGAFQMVEFYSVAEKVNPES